MTPDSSMERAPAPRRLGWKAVALTMVFDLVCLTIATWPRMAHFRTSVPERFDTLQHLWILRWYKTCLLEGRSFFICPEVQYPIGGPLGNFSSMHLQALLYVPLSFVAANDALCYNVVWLFGLMMTGVGTFFLIWHVLGDRACAAFGGMLAMLCGPLMIHAHAHLELIYVGGFPLFLITWMSFVDQPSRGRLALAVLGYVVVSMCAAYYMVYAIFPAVLYVGYQAWRGGTAQVLSWLKSRAGWLAGFAGLAFAAVLVLYSSQVWAYKHGFSIERDRVQFNQFGAPLWAYAIPTQFHWLGTKLPINSDRILGPTAGERSAYLGVVTLALLAYTAVFRVGFRKAAYFWLALLLLVALSCGAYWQLGGLRIRLPSAVLWKVFPLYRMTRVPARLSMFAAVLAGVLAAAGLKHMLARLPYRGLRAAAFAGLATLAVLDLSMAPFWMETLPETPGCYAFLKRRDPKGTLLEIPNCGTGGSEVNAACTYWQALHRMTTSAGYSGQPNSIDDARTGRSSPFHVLRLVEPNYLEDPARMAFDLVSDVDFKDFVWLYMTVNRFDYIILHQWACARMDPPVHIDRLKEQLWECMLYDDGASVVYARSRLRPPARPVEICLEDWKDRYNWQGRPNCRVPRSARVVVYNPEASRDLILAIDAITPFSEQTVRLQAGTREMARWQIVPGAYRTCVSPPFRLPAGLQELTIESGTDLERAKAPSTTRRLHVARLSLYDASDSRAPTLARDDLMGRLKR
jgi:hypothetical protein